MLEIRKNGCVVCKCEFECGGFEQNLSTQLIGNGVYTHSHPNKHTQTQFYPRAKTGLEHCVTLCVLCQAPHEARTLLIADAVVIW
jgi:hypothetical protein